MTLDMNLWYTNQSEIGGSSFLNTGTISQPNNVYTPLFNINQGVPAPVYPAKLANGTIPSAGTNPQNKWSCTGPAAAWRTSRMFARAAGSVTGDGGLGAWFSRRVTNRDAAIAASTGVLVAVGAAALSSPALLAGGLLGFATGIGLGLALVRMRGQLDGDSLGAAVELSFAAILLFTAAIIRWPVG